VTVTVTVTVTMTHRGLHRFHYQGRCVLLIDAGSEYAKQHIPKDFTPFGGQKFGAVLWARVNSDPNLVSLLNAAG